MLNTWRLLDQKYRRNASTWAQYNLGLLGLALIHVFLPHQGEGYYHAHIPHPLPTDQHPGSLGHHICGMLLLTFHSLFLVSPFFSLLLSFATPLSVEQRWAHMGWLGCEYHNPNYSHWSRLLCGVFQITGSLVSWSVAFFRLLMFFSRGSEWFQGHNFATVRKHTTRQWGRKRHSQGASFFRPTHFVVF